MAKTKEKDDLLGLGSGVNLTQDQWMALAYLLFGTAMGKDWRFVCPACKGVQTPKEFNDGGQDAQKAYQQCIKRDSTLKLIQKEKREKRRDECDWAAWGLFQGPWIISAHDEEKGEDYEVSAFGFEGTTQALIDRAIAETEAILKEKNEKEDSDGKKEKA